VGATSVAIALARTHEGKDRDWHVPEKHPLSATLLMLGVLFSSIGVGFLIYGKKQSKLVPLACGLALIVVPYFFASSLLLFVVGSVLVAIPYFIRM
jgi:hypothetical protein